MIFVVYWWLILLSTQASIHLNWAHTFHKHFSQEKLFILNSANISQWLINSTQYYKIRWANSELYKKKEKRKENRTIFCGVKRFKCFNENLITVWCNWLFGKSDSNGLHLIIIIIIKMLDPVSSIKIFSLKIWKWAIAICFD